MLVTSDDDLDFKSHFRIAQSSVEVSRIFMVLSGLF